MMTTEAVERFITSLKEQPIRGLVAYHLQRQDEATRLAAIEGSFGLLPAEVRTTVASQVGVYVLAGHAKPFWDIHCTTFYETVAKFTDEAFADLRIPSNDEARINAFQIVVMGLADAVHDDNAIRNASGIRAAFPLASAIALLYPATAYWRARSLAGDGIEAVGIGVTNFGYLLLAAGIVSGTFAIPGLRSRKTLIPIAIAAIATGVVLTNWA